MNQWIRSGIAGLVVAFSGLGVIGYSIGGEANVARQRKDVGEAGPEGGGKRTRFRLEGEELDRVARRLFDEEIKKDRDYLRGLEGLDEDERVAVLTWNYEDIQASLAECRGRHYRGLAEAVDSFRPYARYLKEQVLADPIDYLRSRGAYRLREADVQAWVDLFVDAFSDEDHVRSALDRLDPQDARRLYRILPGAARALLEPLVGREYPSIAGKKQDLRERLFELRDRIAGDPEGWLRSAGE